MRHDGDGVSTNRNLDAWSNGGRVELQRSRVTEKKSNIFARNLSLNDIMMV